MKKIIMKQISEGVWLEEEEEKVMFKFGDGVRDEIYIYYRYEEGEQWLEIAAGGAITVMPRAANMIRIKLV